MGVRRSSPIIGNILHPSQTQRVVVRMLVVVVVMLVVVVRMLVVVVVIIIMLVIVNINRTRRFNRIK